MPIILIIAAIVIGCSVAHKARSFETRHDNEQQTQPLPADLAPRSVPEPGTLGILAAGAAAAYIARRRRK
jgi:hypothetical protein